MIGNPASKPIGISVGWCIVDNPTMTSETEKHPQEAAKPVYGIAEIMKFLPHRYPFLLVDRILELEPDKRIVGLKNVTINEQFFQGHFPGHPIMPGVLIIEAMAQVGGILAFKSTPPPVPLMEGDKGGGMVYFMGIDKARFRKPVLPGDKLELVIEVTKQRGAIWAFKGEAYVDGNLVAEAELMATIVDK